MSASRESPRRHDKNAALIPVHLLGHRRWTSVEGAVGQVEQIEAGRDRTRRGTTARHSIAARSSSGTAATSRPGNGSCCERSKPFEKCGRRNSERGMGKQKRRMANAGRGMTEGGWRMPDCGWPRPDDK